MAAIKIDLFGHGTLTSEPFPENTVYAATVYVAAWLISWNEHYYLEPEQVEAGHVTRLWCYGEETREYLAAEGETGASDPIEAFARLLEYYWVHRHGGFCGLRRFVDTGLLPADRAEEIFQTVKAQEQTEQHRARKAAIEARWAHHVKMKEAAEKRSQEKALQEKPEQEKGVSDDQ